MEEWSVIFLELTTFNTQLLERLRSVLPCAGRIGSQEASPNHKKNLISERT